ncbi:MAG TPA: HupE/UreJ family protein [Kofleriaceae bacterium]|nr:HupE/UreJ family protein [Kofleriaceae bacterium]
MRPRIIVLTGLLLAALLCRVPAAFAHDVKGSLGYVDIGSDTLQIEWQLPVDELAPVFGWHSLVDAQRAVASPDFTNYIAAHLRITTPQGTPFAVTIERATTQEHDDAWWVRVVTTAHGPAAASPRQATITTDIITHQVVSHHISLFLRHDFDAGHVGELTFLDTLHYQRTSLQLDRAAGSWWRGFAAMVRVGARHIADGRDHLLFLLTLLGPVTLVARRRRWEPTKPLRATVKDIVGVVTAFTLGHSLSLFACALGIVALPSRLVEALIAASIIVAAVHTLTPLFPRRESAIALAFGFIHGFGFASALEGIGFEGHTLILTVVAFNIGVELMQLGIVAVLLPALALGLRSPIGSVLRSTLGVVAASAGCVWLVNRASGGAVAGQAARWLDAAIAHGWLFGLVLYAVAAMALLQRRVTSVLESGQ